MTVQLDSRLTKTSVPDRVDMPAKGNHVDLLWAQLYDGSATLSVRLQRPAYEGSVEIVVDNPNRGEPKYVKVPSDLLRDMARAFDAAADAIDRDSTARPRRPRY